MKKIDLTDEESYLFEAIMAARKVQEFLWGEYNDQWGIEEWKRMFKKRIVKIDDIDLSNPHAFVELKKRVLQNTALGIALLKKLDDRITFENIKRNDCEIPSNLPEYSSEYNARVAELLDAPDLGSGAERCGS